MDHARKNGWINKDMNVEEEALKTQAWGKKIEEQKKWKDKWDGQSQIKNLRVSIEKTIRRTGSHGVSPRMESVKGNAASSAFITNVDGIDSYSMKPHEPYTSRSTHKKA